MNQKPITKPPAINLLLKQQIMQQLQEQQKLSHFKDKVRFEFHKDVEELKANRPRSLHNSHNQYLEENHIFHKDEQQQSSQNMSQDEIKIMLANTQLEESVSSQRHKILENQYDLLEHLLEHILHYVDCTILHSRSTNCLAAIINNYSISENFTPAHSNHFLESTTEAMNLMLLDELKTKLLVTLNSTDNVKDMRAALMCKRNDYQLALKNFKIIMEVMDMNDKSINKLRKQFDDVLTDYQQCRCLVAEDLSYVIGERRKVLVECLNLLEKDLEVWAGQTIELTNLIRNLVSSFNSADDDGSVNNTSNDDTSKKPGSLTSENTVGTRVDDDM